MSDGQSPQNTEEKRLSPEFQAQAGKGRPKGVPNKSTIAVKQALQDAFDQIGGVERLAKFADENPDEFYKLWVKILPQEISGVDGAPLTVNIVRFAGDE